MVTDEHRDFAREVIALARKHRMNNIVLKFQAGFELKHLGWEQITASWCQGRHGDPGQIRMETQAVDTISEKEATDAQR